MNISQLLVTYLVFPQNLSLLYMPKINMGETLKADKCLPAKDGDRCLVVLNTINIAVCFSVVEEKNESMTTYTVSSNDFFCYRHVLLSRVTLHGACDP